MHGSLIEKVIENGLVITEHLPETKAKPYFFPVRNRIIAGLSQGVLVASGGTKSGTLYTAEYAEEYGRHLFAIPYTPNIESGSGCNMLIKQGAILAESSQDILEFFGKNTSKEKVVLTNEQQLIVDAIKNGNNHVEQIAKQLNVAVYQLLPLLSELEIKGVIVKNGTNLYGLQ
ncbi:MAG: DNA-processing protein DprA [Clostridia bacterium]|nr:DNA-processing protein DprA [Clostridia bacterium]